MKYLTLFIILFLFWLSLTFELSPENLITGAVASIAATLFFGKYFVRGVKKFFQPARYFWLIIYLFVFIWECLKANFDVAYRVLHPAMPIRPGIVKVRTCLRSPGGITALANSITLTPGTLTVHAMEDGTLYVHWINVRTRDVPTATDYIVRRFEWFLKRVFE